MLKLNKTAILSSVGAGLEYYDFIIYAFLAQYIGVQFFPDKEHYISLIAAFGFFAVGYFVRPVGGIIFGILGDKYGRKRVFLVSIQIMAFSTFIMGFVPSYHSIGIWGTVIFIVLRLIQGIAFGAELPGATTFITEHSSRERRGLNCAIMISLVTLGVMLGSATVFILTKLLSESRILDWGWRIPFIIGGLLAVVAYFIRVNTEESPYFKKIKQKTGNPFLKLLFKYPGKLFYCFCLMLLPSTMVMFVLVMPTYLEKVYHFKQQDVYLAISIGYGWSFFTLLLFGYLSDYIKRKKLYIYTTAAFILLFFSIFKLLNIDGFYSLLIFVFIYQTFLSLMTVCIYPLLAENFPTEIRFTGVAVCYNLVYALTSLIPLLVNFLYNVFSYKITVLLLLLSIALISLASSFFIKDYTGKQMLD